MKNKIIKLTMAVGLQACDKKSDQDEFYFRFEKYSYDFYYQFLSHNKASAVFLAIRSGFDTQCIKSLVDNPLSLCSSSRLFQSHIIIEAVKNDLLGSLFYHKQ